MKKLFLFLALVLLLFPVAIADQNIDDKINSIIQYAEQYEAGQITYIQMMVYASEIRNELNEAVGEKIQVKKTTEEGEERIEQHEGFSPETVKQMFGTPTEMTSWAWSANENKPFKLEEKMPRWEKIIFDGRNIQIMFNAHPQVVIMDAGAPYKFYWLDFNIRFKQDLDIDIGPAIAEMTQLAQDYKEKKNDGEELAKKIVYYRRIFRSYLEQNKGVCESVVDKFFKPEQKVSQQERLVWEVPLYSGKNLELTGRIDLCEDCEWPWTHMGYDVRIEGPQEKSDSQSKPEQFKREELEKKSLEEIKKLFKEEIEKVIDLAKKADKGDAEALAYLFVGRGNLDLLSEMINQKSYLDERTRKEDYQKVKDFLRSTVSQYGNIEENPIEEIRYENKLVIDIEHRTNKWCRAVDRECKPTEGCANGECVFALGGTETTPDLCHNKQDDDGDGAIDCSDPDCAKDCGRLCEDQCQSCWDCHGMKCQAECKEGNQCGGDQSESCNSARQKCDDCRKTKCPQQCTTCDTCEKEAYNFKDCRTPCDSCNQCQNSGKEDCSMECEECNNCNLPSEAEECKSYCNKIGELEKLECISLCNQGMIWYCPGGTIQRKPCEGLLYQCEGSSLTKHLPCKIFNCEDGTKQNIPCDQRVGCGNNQKIQGSQCLCLEGFYNCDGNNANGCESRSPCSSSQPETCDNKVDDNGNQLVDCEEISSCFSAECGDGKKCNFKGECASEITIQPLPETPQLGRPALEGGSECMIREDCKQQDAICSNGVCKTVSAISQPIQLPSIPENIQIQETDQSKGLTGAFMKLFTGKATTCTSDQECSPNQQCDKLQERCNCKYKFFDCNGDTQGNDADGCESTDPTCGGTRELCPWGCKTNQFCSPESGNCECEKGFWDCDGDWENGCESTAPCTTEPGQGGCSSDSQCAKDRCTEWDNVVTDFGCYEDNGWDEEKGVFAFSGGCMNYQTGRKDSYIEFQAWGRSFEELRGLQESAEKALGPDWCKWELENARKERKELEKSFNQEFLKWFFEEHVAKDPTKWEKQMRGIYDAYWKLADNARKTAETSQCMDQEVPADYMPITLKYESAFGSIEIWEEKVYARQFDREVLTPFMKIWIFPPKEVVKEFMKQAMEKGIMPGPEGEKQQTGPSPEEMERIRNDPKAMKMITEISNEFGGEAKALISIKDEQEIVFQVVITINPDTLITVKPTKDAPSDIDINVDVDFDYVYSMIETSEKDMRGARIESPEWAKKRSITSGLKQAQGGITMIVKVITGFTTGKIKVEPMSAITKAALLFKEAIVQGGK